ncbi:MAG: YggS family pyridoxal phosphate-dependent enzyme [Phycisphaeraceae bacterium]|nr:MAG: YggS family pyridoxal phosphate-dependent enzyme [Phycisphaeraceae bacterium]
MSASGAHTSGTSLAERYAAVRDHIAEAAGRAGRAADEVILVAVTKHAEPEDIRALMELGHVDFGENRPQQLVQRAAMADEWVERVRVLGRTAEDHAAGDARSLDPDRPARWHMIGHLQRNKARKVIDRVRLVHSVDSLRLAEELQAALRKGDRRLDVLLQVNVSGEGSKQGCLSPAVPAMVEQIESMYSLRLRGLMTMAPYSDDPEDARPHFARCRELFEEVRASGAGEGGFNLLSMGMSGDYGVAIEEGANIVRVGTAIFGDQGGGGEEPAA